MCVFVSVSMCLCAPASHLVSPLVLLCAVVGAQGLVRRKVAGANAAVKLAATGNVLVQNRLRLRVC